MRPVRGVVDAGNATSNRSPVEDCAAGVWAMAGARIVHAASSRARLNWNRFGIPSGKSGVTCLTLSHVRAANALGLSNDSCAIAMSNRIIDRDQEVTLLQFLPRAWRPSA